MSLSQTTSSTFKNYLGDDVILTPETIDALKRSGIIKIDQREVKEETIETTKEEELQTYETAESEIAPAPKPVNMTNNASLHNGKKMELLLPGGVRIKSSINSLVEAAPLLFIFFTTNEDQSIELSLNPFTELQVKYADTLFSCLFLSPAAYLKEFDISLFVLLIAGKEKIEGGSNSPTDRPL